MGDRTSTTILIILVLIILFYLYRQGILIELAKHAGGGTGGRPPMVNPHQYIWVCANSSQSEIGRETIVAGGKSQTPMNIPSGTAFITCGVTKQSTGETGWTGWRPYNGQNTGAIMLNMGRSDYAHDLSLTFFHKDQSELLQGSNQQLVVETYL